MDFGTIDASLFCVKLCIPHVHLSLARKFHSKNAIFMECLQGVRARAPKVQIRSFPPIAANLRLQRSRRTLDGPEKSAGVLLDPVLDAAFTGHFRAFFQVFSADNLSVFLRHRPETHVSGGRVCVAGDFRVDAVHVQWLHPKFPGVGATLAKHATCPKESPEGRSWWRKAEKDRRQPFCCVEL